MAERPPNAVEPSSRAAWRAWLAENYETAPYAWLVTRKKAAGGPALTYAEAVEDALCVGWVDSLPRALDAERTMLYFARRKRGRGWSRPNKERVAHLEAAGQMLPAGQAVVDAARADGSWSSLDDVENLVVPDDLAAALADRPLRALGGLPAVREARHPRVDPHREAGRDARAPRRRDCRCGVAERAGQPVAALTDYAYSGWQTAQGQSPRSASHRHRPDACPSSHTI